MNIKEIKSVLSQYSKLVLEKEILENKKQKLLKSEARDITRRISELRIMLDTLEHCLSLLNKDETFVIRQRLFNNLQWKKVMELYTTEFGIENIRSERTLKRLQTRAMNKLLDLVITTNTAKFFHTHYRK